MSEGKQVVLQSHIVEDERQVSSCLIWPSRANPLFSYRFRYMKQNHTCTLLLGQLCICSKAAEVTSMEHNSVVTTQPSRPLKSYFI